MLNMYKLSTYYVIGQGLLRRKTLYLKVTLYVPRTKFLKFTKKFMIFNWNSVFVIEYQYFALREPSGEAPGPKMNYMLNLNIFFPLRPNFALNILLGRAYQDLKLCI